MYLNTPAQPISTSVAALPLVLLQWPQLLSFVQDFELCPALISRAQLAALPPVLLRLHLRRARAVATA